MGYVPGPWNEKAISALLGYGRKNDGPWDDEYIDGEYTPDDNDATLIAIAPDMYEALKHCYDMLKTGREEINDDNDESELTLTNGDEWIHSWVMMERIIEKVEGKR